MQHSVPLKDRAQGRWREILPALGVDSRMLHGRHCACPICGGKDRWRFDDLEGRGTSICNQCGAMDGVTLLMKLKGWDFATVAREIETIIGTDAAPIARAAIAPDKDAAEKFLEAKAFWQSGQRIEFGDPVDLYLRGRVGKYEPTRALKYIPATPVGDNGLAPPAMISAYVDVHGDLAGVQRTLLTRDGRKAGLKVDRLNTGALPEGGAVRLMRPTGSILGIAEGVETALSAAAMFGLPVWAALNDGRLAVWEPPEGMTEIVIFGDADPGYAGQAAAFALAKRLVHKRKLAVQVMIPPDLGTDWNDVLQSRRHAA